MPNLACFSFFVLVVSSPERVQARPPEFKTQWLKLFVVSVLFRIRLHFLPRPSILIPVKSWQVLKVHYIEMGHKFRSLIDGTGISFSRGDGLNSHGCWLRKSALLL